MGLEEKIITEIEHFVYSKTCIVFPAQAEIWKSRPIHEIPMGITAPCRHDR